jgi:triosephosphate isomerase
MLHGVGATFCIVGHSERRAAGESNEDVRVQLGVVAGAGLVPVLCVGELEQAPDGAHFSFIEEQLTSATKGLQSMLGKLVVAYEPVWAIGKSADAAMKPLELQETVIFIRKTLANILGREDAISTPILYGGSVEPSNARSLIVSGEVSGFLVGHASAELDSFVEILQSCKK